MKRTALWRIREKFRHEKRPLLKEAFNQVTPSSSKFVYSLRSLLSKYTQNQNTSFKEPNPPPTFGSSNMRRTDFAKKTKESIHSNLQCAGSRVELHVVGMVAAKLQEQPVQKCAFARVQEMK